MNRARVAVVFGAAAFVLASLPAAAQPAVSVQATSVQATSAQATSAQQAVSSCGVSVGVVDDGHYRTRNVDRDHVAALPKVKDYGPVPSGTNLRTLGTGKFDADPSMPGLRWSEVQYLATSARNAFVLRARDDEAAGLAVTLDRVASQWGNFRRLVDGTALTTYDNPFVYGLHDDGALHRLRRTDGVGGMPTFESAGSVAGFDDLQTMTLVGQTPQYDALLATTNTGELVVIKIPLTSTMTVDRTVIRSAGWQDVDQLAVDTCPDSTTMLIAANSATGVARAYSMEFLRDSSAQLTDLGQVGGSWSFELFSSEHGLVQGPRGA